jgi:hypothetical protein
VIDRVETRWRLHLAHILPFLGDISGGGALHPRVFFLLQLHLFFRERKPLTHLWIYIYNLPAATAHTRCRVVALIHLRGRLLGISGAIHVLYIFIATVNGSEFHCVLCTEGELVMTVTSPPSRKEMQCITYAFQKKETSRGGTRYCIKKEEL